MIYKLKYIRAKQMPAQLILMSKELSKQVNELDKHFEKN